MLVSYSPSVYINTPSEKMGSVRRCLANYPCAAERKKSRYGNLTRSANGGPGEEGCGEEARRNKMDSHISHVTQFIYLKSTIVCKMYVKSVVYVTDGLH